MAPLPYSAQLGGKLRQMHRYTPTIYTGDCRDMLAELDDNSVDLILTDPPYQLGEFMQSRNAGVHRMRDNFLVSAGWDNGDRDSVHTLLEDVISESARVLKKRGALVMFLSTRLLSPVQEMADANKLYYKTTGVWHKTNPMPLNMNLHFVSSTELWVYYVAGGRTGTFNNDGKVVHNFVETSVTPKSQRAFGKHPTQKPVELMEHFVSLLSNPGELVVDPFLGSGTTAVAAHNLGRRVIGSEIDPKYAEITRKRCGLD